METLSSWKMAILSQAGRGLMINAVIKAMPTHLMSCLLLPSEVVDDLHSLSTKFIWSPDIQEQRMSWCAQSKLCRCKSTGGCGFKDIESFNEAMLATQG